jgi:hypothetical protein
MINEPLPVRAILTPTVDILDAALWRLPVVRTQFSEHRPLLPRWLRLLVLRRDGWRCRWCGISTREGFLQVDHVIPWSAGGSDRTDNLRALCEPCNRERSNRWGDLDAARPIPISCSCIRCWPEVQDDQRVPVWCQHCRQFSTADTESLLLPPYAPDPPRSDL